MNKYRVYLWFDEYKRMNANELLNYAANAVRSKDAEELEYDLVEEGLYKITFKFKFEIETDNMFGAFQSLSQHLDSATRMQIVKVKDDEKSMEEVSQ